MKSFAILYSSKPVNEQFIFSDRFLIRPLVSGISPPYPMFDHPFVIQFEQGQQEAGSYPWAKHLWDEMRLKKLEKGKDKTTEEDFSKWLDAHKQFNEWSIPQAVTNEITYLITFLSNAHIKRPTGGATWGMQPRSILPNEHLSDPFPVICNYFVADESAMSVNEVGGRWKEIDKNSELDRFSRIQYGYIAGTEYNRLQLPVSVNLLLGRYFNLNPKKRLATYTGIACYYKALRLRSDHPTLALISLSMGIECLLNSLKKRYKHCSTCNAQVGVEKCAECGASVYRLKSEFVSFMNTYAGPHDEASYRQLYDIRSTSVHGELLRAEFQDTGFYVDEKDEQQMFLDVSIAVTRQVLMNWINTN